MKKLPENYFVFSIEKDIWMLIHTGIDNPDEMIRTGIRIKAESIGEAIRVANEYIPFFEKKWVETGVYYADDVLFY